MVIHLMPLYQKISVGIAAGGVFLATFKRGQEILKSAVIKPIKAAWFFLTGPQRCVEEVKESREENQRQIAAQNQVMANLGDSIETIRKEITANGGSSIKDQVTALLKNQGHTQLMISLVQEYIRAINEAVDHGVILITPNGQILRVNTPLCRLLNRGMDEFLGDNWVNLVTPEGREPALREWNDAVRHRRNMLFNFSFVKPDGIKVPVILTATRLADENGGTLGWQADVRKTS